MKRGVGAKNYPFGAFLKTITTVTFHNSGKSGDVQMKFEASTVTVSMVSFEIGRFIGIRSHFES